VQGESRPYPELNEAERGESSDPRRGYRRGGRDRGLGRKGIKNGKNEISKGRSTHQKNRKSLWGPSAIKVEKRDGKPESLPRSGEPGDLQNFRVKGGGTDGLIFNLKPVPKRLQRDPDL